MGMDPNPRRQQKIPFPLRFEKKQKTFMCNEWTVGHTNEWMQPPSTGAGHDSKHDVDGKHYFRRTKHQHNGYPTEAPR